MEFIGLGKPRLDDQVTKFAVKSAYGSALAFSLMLAFCGLMFASTVLDRENSRLVEVATAITSAFPDVLK